MAQDNLEIENIYPSLSVEYKSIILENLENLNVISNFDPSLSSPSNINDFRFININKGIRIFGVYGGSYTGTVSTDANAVNVDMTNFHYIDIDAPNSSLLIRNNSAGLPLINFRTTRNTSNVLACIYAYGRNSVSANKEYARILLSSETVTSGSEQGSITFNLANGSGGNSDILKIEGDGMDALWFLQLTKDMDY